MLTPRVRDVVINLIIFSPFGLPPQRQSGCDDFSNAGNPAKFVAILLASSLLSNLAAERRPASRSQ
jgi:hypothetical protein